MRLWKNLRLLCKSLISIDYRDYRYVRNLEVFDVQYYFSFIDDKEYLAGDPLLTVRGDVAEECWRILEPVVEAWQNGSVEMHEYRAGSTGPTNWSSS